MEFGIQILSSVNDQVLMNTSYLQSYHVTCLYQFNNFLNNSNDTHVVFQGHSQTFGDARA